MSSSPHQGGTLSSMAPTGTRMPNDAGLQNTIPSVPRPDQRSENPQFTNQGLGTASLATAADNSADVPRSTTDAGHGAAGALAQGQGDVVTGTGDTMPSEVETKRLQIGGGGGADAAAKGHGRDMKHAVKNRGVFDTHVKMDEDAEGKVGGEHRFRQEKE